MSDAMTYKAAIVHENTLRSSNDADFKSSLLIVLFTVVQYNVVMMLIFVLPTFWK